MKRPGLIVEIEHVVIGAVWRCTLDTKRATVTIEQRLNTGAEHAITVPWCDRHDHEIEHHLVADSSTEYGRSELLAVQAKLRLALHEATTN